MEPPDPCPACLAGGAYAATARGERQPARLSASTETAPPLASPAVTELPQLQEHGARVRTLADLRERLAQPRDDLWALQPEEGVDALLLAESRHPGRGRV